MEGYSTYHPTDQTCGPRITEVRISARDDPILKAFASITIDECFVIRGLKVIQREGDLFVAMPCRKRPDGSFQDLVHPTNDATRQQMSQVAAGLGRSI